MVRIINTIQQNELPCHNADNLRVFSDYIDIFNENDKSAVKRIDFYNIQEVSVFDDLMRI